MLHPVSLMYGTDPEGFFERAGKIIGSERVLPEDGLFKQYSAPVVVRDGVQFELNPAAGVSIAGLANNLSSSVLLLQQHLQRTPDVKLNWNRIVEVERAELNSLSVKARLLGCLPSMNIYGKRPLKCNVKTYRKRSTGGHMHFGLTSTNVFSSGQDYRSRLVPLLDIFVGSFCVLLDRDSGAAERRENYGRAGEFRLPKHGLEYRTPDNFWMRSYTLMSFVFGMANLATSVLVNTVLGNNLEAELVKTVNIRRIIKAIDNNDIRLAKQNVTDLQSFFGKHVPDSGFPLNAGTLGKFIELGNAVDAKGIASFFPDNPETFWTGQNTRQEFNTFLEGL